MAGTRLLIHTTFVLQLFILIAFSYFYASTKKHGRFSSVEPFIIDRSGWNLLHEDVAPAGNEGFVARALEIGDAIMKKAELLLGGDKQVDERSAPSTFVEEMNRKIARLQLTTDGDVRLPQLNIQVIVPQLSNVNVQSVANALERGLQKVSPLHLLVSAVDVEPITSCDEYITPQSTSKYRAQKPQVVILTGCSSITKDTKAEVQISQNVPVIIVRTRYNPSTDVDELIQLLEENVAPIIFNEVNIIASTRHSLSHLHIDLIDENPVTRSGGDRSNAKYSFEAVGEAFASSVRLLIMPMLQDLTFLYGGSEKTHNIDINGSYSVNLSTDVSAYLPLPDDQIKIDAEEDEHTSTKYLSTEHIASWASSRLKKPQVVGDSLQWSLIVPSQDHSPLVIHDELTGGDGTSATFSNKLEHELPGVVSGLSIVNLDPKIGVDNSNIQQSLQNVTSLALLYLFGYIRAHHGLPTLPNQANKSTPAVSVSYTQSTYDKYSFSFWELEAIARKHWYPTLQKVLYETEALMALLNTHRSLAFPEHTAHKLNNATDLLRQSVLLVEQNYPTQYATSTLYGALYNIESVTNDPDLMELPHFAIDHYLAVFSPLILPLMMPLIVGLVREIKRYRKLKKKVIEEASIS